MRFSLVLLMLSLMGLGAVAQGQAWVPFQGELPGHAFVPTGENSGAGAICRMTGPLEVSPRHLLGSVQEEDGRLVCRGATYSASEHAPSGKKIISDPQFEVLVVGDDPPSKLANTAAECPFESHYEGHMFCEGSVRWENLEPKVGVEEIWQGLLCVKALRDCDERGGSGSVVCRRWDKK